MLLDEFLMNFGLFLSHCHVSSALTFLGESMSGPGCWEMGKEGLSFINFYSAKVGTRASLSLPALCGIHLPDRKFHEGRDCLIFIHCHILSTMQSLVLDKEKINTLQIFLR